mmetsp:Transcript_23674/g.50549  ORF Transcript_23674/g.50549 Transcript_23674/m.50549 type:complete len:429 (+) Transcript_23674:170-1456(+)
MVASAGTAAFGSGSGRSPVSPFQKFSASASASAATPDSTAQAPKAGNYGRAPLSAREGRPRPSGNSAPKADLPEGMTHRGSFDRLFDEAQQETSQFSVTMLSSCPSESFLNGLRSQSQWSQEMPEALLFPANKPSSTADAIVLDKWISNSFANYAQRTASRNLDDEEELTRAVEELVPILSIGLHELSRQVSQNCLERGVVLEKIWRTYVDLFEKALSGTRKALRKQREKTAKVERDLSRTQREVEELKRKHPAQIQRLSATLQGKFAQRAEDLREQLLHVSSENDQLNKDLRHLSGSASAWFPNFSTYKVSMFREFLEKMPPEPATSDTPEAQMAADFGRVLSALPVETRRRVGYYISSLLGLRSTRMTPDSVEALTECRDHNAWKIEQLTARLQDLKGSRAGSKEAPQQRASNIVTAEEPPPLPGQ